MTLILSNIVHSFTSTNNSGSGQCNISVNMDQLVLNRDSLVAGSSMSHVRFKKNCGGNALFPTEIGDRA
jgi:hypothetical protein